MLRTHTADQLSSAQCACVRACVRTWNVWVLQSGRYLPLVHLQLQGVDLIDVSRDSGTRAASVTASASLSHSRLLSVIQIYAASTCCLSSPYLSHSLLCCLYPPLNIFRYMCNPGVPKPRLAPAKPDAHHDVHHETGQFLMFD